MAVGGVLAAVGAAIRNGSGGSNETYLLDAAGLLTAVSGAVIEAKTADLFFEATPVSAMRRAIALAFGGIVAALSGCVLASFVFDDSAHALLPAGAMFILVGGAGAGLAGLFSLAWYYGGEYAAKRIERLSDQEW